MARIQKSKNEPLYNERQIFRVLSNKKRDGVIANMSYQARQSLSPLIQIVRSDKIYTAYQKMDSMVLLITLGSLAKVAQKVKVPIQVIEGWMRTQWWKQGMRILAEVRQEELDAKLSRILHRSGEEILDRIENGEEVVTPSGRVVRVGVKAKDLATIQNSAYKNRSLIRGEPTTISESKKSDEKTTLEQLKEQFAKIATQNNRVIDITPTNEDLINESSESVEVS